MESSTLSLRLRSKSQAAFKLPFQIFYLVGLFSLQEKMGITLSRHDTYEVRYTYIKQRFQRETTA